MEQMWKTCVEMQRMKEGNKEKKRLSGLDSIISTLFKLMRSLQDEVKRTQEEREESCEMESEVVFGGSTEKLCLPSVWSADCFKYSANEIIRDVTSKLLYKHQAIVTEIQPKQPRMWQLMPFNLLKVCTKKNHKPQQLVMTPNKCKLGDWIVLYWLSFSRVAFLWLKA